MKKNIVPPVILEVSRAETVSAELIVSTKGYPLTPQLSLKLRNHSPSGFDYGYLGSAPSQLALAVMIAIYSVEVSLKHYMKFKEDVIETLKNDNEVVGIGSYLYSLTGKIPNPRTPETINADISQWKRQQES